MIIEKTEQGYWLAAARYKNRLILAEGATWKEAMNAWAICATELAGFRMRNT